MKEPRILRFKKTEIPESYHKDIARILLDSERDFFDFEPPKIEYYYNSLKIPFSKETEQWITGNASVNKFMCSINQTLKHKLLFVECGYEMSKEKWKI